MKLIFHTVSDGVLEFEVDKNSVLIGRGSSCDVILKVEGISRQHCRIDLSPNGEFTVTDLGSTNGVLIDNARIPANEEIEYNSYLPLAIGSIPHVTLEAGRVVQEERILKAHEQKQVNIELDIPGNKKKAVTKKTMAQAAAKSSKVTIEKGPPWVLIGCVIVGLLAFTYFFFLS